MSSPSQPTTNQLKLHVGTSNAIFYSLFALSSSKEIGFHSIQDHFALSLAQILSQDYPFFFLTHSNRHYSHQNVLAVPKE